MREFYVNGATLRADVLGEGIPLVLVHGFPFDHRMWLPLYETAMRDPCGNPFQWILPDLRGMGTSEIQPGAEVSTMADFADDIAAILDQLSVDKCIFGGLSMGGYVGWEFWARHANRMKALIVSDTNANADTPDGAKKRWETAERVLREGTGFLADSMAGNLLAPENNRSDSPAFGIYNSMVRENNPVGVACAARGMTQRRAFSDSLGEVAVPSLVVGGLYDKLSTPEYLTALAEALPQAIFTVIPQSGHLAPLENPEDYWNCIKVLDNDIIYR